MLKLREQLNEMQEQTYLEYGARVFCNENGELLAIVGEMSGNLLPRPKIDSIYCVDVPYNSINWTRHHIKGVNIETMEVILGENNIPMSPEQEKILEIENALLLATENEVGGIL